MKDATYLYTPFTYTHSPDGRTFTSSVKHKNDSSVYEILEAVFAACNRGSGFEDPRFTQCKIPSLSVGDRVALDTFFGDSAIRVFQCKHVGWSEIPQKENNLNIPQKENNLNIPQNQYPMKIRTTQLTIAPQGEPIFHEEAIIMTIVDEAAGEYIEIERCFDGASKDQKISLMASEWPVFKKAVDILFNEIAEHEELQAALVKSKK
jgi:hypothetical protein